MGRKSQGWIRRVHLWLGLAVSIPVFSWSLSGFLLALPPEMREGEPYAIIERQRVLVSPVQAIQAVDEFLGIESQLTSLNLEQRGQNPIYRAFGKYGGFLVDAQTGEVRPAPPPSKQTSWIRNAHFFNFAGPARTMLLLIFSFLAGCSALSGILLALGTLRGRRRSLRESKAIRSSRLS